MAVSKKRDDKAVKAFKAPRNLGKPSNDNPKWLLPVALTALALGPTWIVVYYVSKANYPIPGIGDWNLAVGFVFMAAGMVLLTRWK
ncbi:cell division protein CrgA [Demequina sediminis]|uniref:Cell division protein CrgA n=1 Tax=Demequina sediminis TaxID=1930058 RepID=A0ABP9WG40_9MICO